MSRKRYQIPTRFVENNVMLRRCYGACYPYGLSSNARACVYVGVCVTLLQTVLRIWQVLFITCCSSESTVLLFWGVTLTGVGAVFQLLVCLQLFT